MTKKNKDEENYTDDRYLSQKNRYDIISRERVLNKNNKDESIINDDIIDENNDIEFPIKIEIHYKFNNDSDEIRLFYSKERYY